MGNILSDALLMAGRYCAGCSVCETVCSPNAITMKPDVWGFLYPEIEENKCIHCNQCTRVCPVLNWENDRLRFARCYAAKADDEIRKQASSGGVFPLLCNRILLKGGIVYGAAMEAGSFEVRHIKVTSSSEAGALFRSKYVQSSMNGIYADIAEEIQKGKEVLFSGTPCQVMAIRNYLGEKVNEKVYLVDILCHGVPSPQMWRDYLKENLETEKIIAIEFRNKEPGWRADELKVIYKDGHHEIIGRQESAYEEGFMNYLSLRDGCEECVFACESRPGDITIGDFWGIGRYDAGIDDHQGVSEILVNNEKGKILLESIRNELISLEQVPISYARENRMQPTAPHPLKARFKELYPRRGFSEAISDVVKERYDIGLVAHYCAQNFGAQLTQWALYHILTNAGYSVLMIERPKNADPILSSPDPYLFEKDPYPDYAKGQLYDSIEDMKILNEQCSIFISGSDQMFNPYSYLHMQKFQSLNFVTDDHVKIGYAISWGRKDFPDDKSILADEAFYLRKYDAISAREDTGREKLHDDFGIENAELVLDPVFLCSKEDYLALMGNAKTGGQNEKYLCVYVLDISDEQVKVILQQALKCGIKKILMFANPAKQGESFHWKDENLEEIEIEWLKNQSIESWLNIIYHADYIFTDSYHGTCLALLFNIPFVCMANKYRGVDRFTSLFHLLGLDAYLAYNWKEVDQKFNYLLEEPIPFDIVNSILAEQVKRSSAWLFAAIKQNKPKSYSTYDVLDRRIDLQEKEIRRVIELEQTNMNQILSEQEARLSEIDRKYNELRIEKQKAEELQTQLNSQLLRATRWRRKIVSATSLLKNNGLRFTLKYATEKMKLLRKRHSS